MKSIFNFFIKKKITAAQLLCLPEKQCIKTFPSLIFFDINRKDYSSEFTIGEFPSYSQLTEKYPPFTKGYLLGVFYPSDSTE